MPLILEIEIVRCKHASIQITLDRVLLFALHGAHDSRSKVDSVAEDGEFFPTTRCASDSRETLARRDSDVAVSVWDLLERVHDIETGQQGT